MKWQKKLTRKQTAHVREWMTPDGVTPTLSAIRRTRIAQADIARMREGMGLVGEPCWDCRDVAVRLGLEAT